MNISIIMYKGFFQFLTVMVFAVLFALSACGPKELPEIPEGTVKLNFRAVYDTTAIIMGSPDRLFSHMGDKVRFDEFRFFISNVNLNQTSNQSQAPIIGEDAVELVDLSDRSNPERARAGKSLFRPIRLGDYSGIQLDFGVPSTLNLSEYNPSMYEIGNDLRNPKVYSESLKSYIFFELKGSVNGVGDFNLKIGTDQFYMEDKFFEGSAIVTDLNENIEFNFVIDFKKVLAGIKLSEHRVVTPGNLEWLGDQVMDNLVEKGIKLGIE